MLEAIILDTETTRREADPVAGIPQEVIELCCEDLAQSPNTFVSCLYEPAYPIQLGAMATHNITPEILKGLRPSSEAPGDVPVAEYWIGHNIDFDWKALGSPPAVKRICTLALAREVWPDLDSHKLGALMYHIHGQTAATAQLLRNAHSAVADVGFCRDVLTAILAKTGEISLPALYTMSEEARVPKKWAFGKFMDSPIGHADRGYAGWFTRTCTDRPDYAYYMIALRRAGLVR